MKNLEEIIDHAYNSIGQGVPIKTAMKNAAEEYALVAQLEEASGLSPESSEFKSQ